MGALKIIGHNATLFGDVPDGYDQLVAYNESELTDWVESTGCATWAMTLNSPSLSNQR